MSEFNCPHCESVQKTGEIDLGEHFVDLPDECEECHHIYTEQEKMTLYDKVMENEMGMAIDRAMLLHEDR